MAFTKQKLQYKRFEHFAFFATVGEDGTIEESLDLTSKQFYLTEIRVHCSVAFASVEDLTIRMSAAQGSAYNLMIISQAMKTVMDVLWQADNSMHMLSDDDIVFNLSQASGVNVIGITVLGWAVIGT